MNGTTTATAFNAEYAKDAEEDNGGPRVNGNGSVVSFLPMSAFDVLGALGALAVGALDLRRTGTGACAIDLTVAGRGPVGYHGGSLTLTRRSSRARRPALVPPAAPDAYGLLGGGAVRRTLVG